MHYLKFLASQSVSDIHPMGAAASSALIEALALRSGQRLLELGCGTGNTVFRLARRADVDVVGLDLMNEMLSAAQRRLRSVDRHCWLVRANAAALPFYDHSFDRVYAESVFGIHSAVDVRSMLTEAFRVLKPGGLFVANEAIWKPHIDQSTVDEVNRRTEVDFGLRQASEHAWSVDRWLDEIHHAGFRLVSWEKLAALARENIPANRVELWIKRMRIFSSPALWRRHRAYRQRLARHRMDGSLIEARLFVSERPV